MAKTLDEALSQIFGTNFQTEGAAIEDEAGDTSILTYDQLIQQLKAAYQNAKTSAQTGKLGRIWQLSGTAGAIHQSAGSLIDSHHGRKQ